MLKITFILSLLVSFSALAVSHSRIDTLGMSKVGNIVALEEYGYKPDEHVYFVSIKFLDVWKKEYVGSSINVKLPAHPGIRLIEARKKARQLATGEMQKHKISG